MAFSMRRGVKQAQSTRRPEPRRHEIPAWLGAPLWAIGKFLRRSWKKFAYVGLVIAVFYLPYLLHIHAHTLKDAQCDQLKYATYVSYTYGCTGLECSAEKEAYVAAMDVQLGLMGAGCYAEPPPRPDEVIVMLTSTLKSLTEGDDGAAPEETLVAETT